MRVEDIKQDEVYRLKNSPNYGFIKVLCVIFIKPIPYLLKMLSNVVWETKLMEEDEEGELFLY
jgi:hypothetical protein